MQRDTIIPDLSNPQSWNRYSYVQNNPIKLNDPTGHKDSCGDNGGGCSSNYTPPPVPDVEPNPGNGDIQCQNDPDCELNGNHDEGGLGPTCYPGELVCQLAKDDSKDPVSLSPDYYSLNGCYGIIFIFGICAQIVRDYYNNWYWGVGPGVMSSSAYSFNAGWLWQSGRSEESIQNFTLKWSAFGGATLPIPHPLAGLGGAVTWGDPSLTRPFDSHDLAGEVQMGNAGWAGGMLYDSWIYDSGDPTPWFWQDRDGINNINP